MLNISAIRINRNAGADVNGGGWVTIPVPSAAGNGRGSSPGDLQIDLLTTQTGATLFNVGGVPQGTYATVQVVVDPTNSGTIIPACQTLISNQEGCIGYPIFFTVPNQAVVLTLPAPFSVAKDTTAPLLLQLALTIDSQPTASGGVYGVTVTVSQADSGSFMGTVTGTVARSGVPTGIHLIPLSVTAVLSGTNTVIESAKVSSPRSGNTFTLVLPAFPVVGTSYDLYAAGGGFTYDSKQAITVTPGSLISGVDFSVATSSNTGSFSGVIQDACTGLGISGATVDLLAPSDQISPTPDCSVTPSQCVVVASTSSDQAGNYPLPGTTKNPSPFNQIPSGEHDLALQITASGYTTVLGSALVQGANGQQCGSPPAFAGCSFAMPTGYLSGTVGLSQTPPPGSSVQVQVLAENSGTNQLIAALSAPLVFTSGLTSLPFTMNVPFGSASNFDLLAVAIDPFLGTPDPFPGHDIQVVAAVPAPTAQCVASAQNVAFPDLNCVGHGSISGTVSNPDLGTTVEVSKQNVQILSTAPALLSSTAPSNNQYTLCVPPDSYAVQRAENGVPQGVAQNVTVPQPAATSTPCPTSCSDSTGSICPGQCIATTLNPL